MDDTEELARLKRYAAAANMNVYGSQADLNPKDHVRREMVIWCERRGNIIVLESGLILTNQPVSRDVQNCKTVMRNKGFKPDKVVAATESLIKLLLTSVPKEEIAAQEESEEEESFSMQQQRLRLLVREAIEANVSDIHIEVRTEVAKIRFRKYGELYLHAEWFPRLGREAASVAFNKETDHATAHFNPLVPQNASMPLDIDATHVRLRLASAPAHGGFDVVMRILSVGDEEKKVTLEELGYTPEQVYIIQRAIQMPHGAVLVAGPTGSGKTTTLASCLQMVKNTCKIYSIEDPVEKVVSHATQVPVNADKADRTFASFGRAALRMDPDYIVLGEMRDEDTVTVMIRAALTGHLVMSTVHTNSAIGIVTRLMDMGVSNVMLSDAGLLVCLMFQRLVPTLCDDCKAPLEQSPSHQSHIPRWVPVLGEAMETMYVRGEVECETCRGSGLSGRTVVAEVIWVDEPGREFIQKQDLVGWQQYLKKQGWTDYRDQTLALVRQGKVDPFDAETIIGEISEAMKMKGFDYNDVRRILADEQNGLTQTTQPKGD